MSGSEFLLEFGGEQTNGTRSPVVHNDGLSDITDFLSLLVHYIGVSGAIFLSLLFIINDA